MDAVLKMVLLTQIDANSFVVDPVEKAQRIQTLLSRLRGWVIARARNIDYTFQYQMCGYQISCLCAVHDIG